MISASEALKRLREGNRRFVDGKAAEIHRAHKLMEQQEPFAVVLGCSDSRVPPELVFDQGIGDLFVIRVGGNVVTPLEIGSAEFAAAQVGTRLIVVLSHTNCGAVQATVETVLSAEHAELSEGMGVIVDQIRGSVDADPEHDLDAVVCNAIEANRKNSINRLRMVSPVLRDLIANDGLVIVGAHYSMETGVVEFVDC